MKSAISQILPRLLGSVLITATFLAQTLPVSAQPAATNPPGSATPPAASPAPAAPRPAASAATPTASAAPATDDAAAQPAPPAPARDEEGAKAALAKGQEAYRNGDYAGAAQAFAESNQLAPSPTAKYWHAMALDLQGLAAEAVAAFGELFSTPGHEALGEDLLTPARKRFELLEKIPATVLLQVTPASAMVEVDGVAQQGSAPFTLKLAAGKHQLKVSQEGFEPLTTELDVSPAQSVEQAVELVPLPAAPPPVVEPPPVATAPEPPAPAEPRSKVPAYVTLGVAGVSAALGTVFGLQALSAKSDFEDDPTASNADAVERNALIADMAWGIALTLGITGVVLLTTDEPAPTEQAKANRRRQVAGGLRVAPYVTPSGGGAAARLTF